MATTMCEWGSSCPTPAAYFVVINSALEECWNANVDGTCPGHPFCVEHTAEARTEPGITLSARTLRPSDVETDSNPLEEVASSR